MQHCTIPEINNEQRMNEAIMMTKKEQNNTRPPVGCFSGMAGRREKKKVHHSNTLTEHDVTDLWLTSNSFVYNSAISTILVPSEFLFCLQSVMRFFVFCANWNAQMLFTVRTLPLYPWAILGSSYWSLNNPLSFSQWKIQSGNQNSNHIETCGRRSIILIEKFKCVCVCVYFHVCPLQLPLQVLSFSQWVAGAMEKKRREIQKRKARDRYKESMWKRVW